MVPVSNTRVEQPFESLCENWISIHAMEREQEIFAPEGRLIIARRFSAGESGKRERVPEGRLRFSHSSSAPEPRFLPRITPVDSGLT
jgi:hypothetical protein